MDSEKIDERILKPYDPQATEDRIYKLWEKSGFFNPDVCVEKGVTAPSAEKFSIVLPPPNVTGTLHVGHAVMLAIEDIMVRFNRMRGKKTLWLPGTDHAAIATQTIVEKKIKKEEGKSKHDLGREEFFKRVNQFAQESHNTIINQIKKMGASLDWSREAFTLDEERSLAVKTAFKRMYEAGLIYRGYRIVNWDPRGQTVISDDEVEHQEKKSKLYTFRYAKDFPFAIATTRPETKVGDTAVAVHPDDDRYKKYIGKEYNVDFVGIKLKLRIIADKAVDPVFGTGAVGVTPAHSIADSEIAKRHNLPVLQVINEYARMNVEAPLLKDKKTTEAREIIVEWLKKEGLLEKEEEIDQSISVAERSGGIIEPLPKLQWFIDVNKKFPSTALRAEKIKGIKSGQEVTLKELMIHVVKEGLIKIIPERFEKTYFHWIENLRDWCISRQIWYGHRIPVWYDKENNVYLPKEQKIIFVRHGESEANAKGIIAGNSSSPLTEKGQKEAKEMVKDLKDENITLIFASALPRSMETAQIIGRGLGVKVVEWHEMHEVDSGVIEGTPSDPEKSQLERAVEKDTGEGLDDLEKRAKQVIKKLKELDEDGNILVVGHNTFTSIIFAVWNGIPKEEFIDYRKRWRGFREKPREKTLLKDPAESGLEQDPDTLDTWFSSGLWTFSTLGWPQDTVDLKTYHPTDVLETAHDILFFWVARMILMTTFLLGDIPFHTVYLHGFVLDKYGKKMTKSRPETAIDLLVSINQYGADALRMAMIVGVGPGQSMKLSEDKIRGYKHFANKIWNASRFVLSILSNSDEKLINPDKKPELTEKDKKYLKELDDFVKEITKDIEEYKFYLAGEKLYHYFWHTFADIIIEESKKKLKEETASEEKLSAQYTLYTILTTCLKALHPFMPFITEEIWGLLPKHENTKAQEHKNKLLMVEKWPTQVKSYN